MTAAGKVTTHGYDGANRLASVSRPDIGTFGFTYNPDGQLSTITRPNGVTSTNGYDTAGRLNGLTYKNPGGTAIATYGYTLDAAGNRVSASTNGATDHYNIDPAGSASYSYDSFGNLASATSGATTIAYQTNGSGLRVSATSGPTTSTYTWDEAAGLPSLLSDGTAGYLSADSQLLAETSASSSAYPLTDALGSVRATSGSTGSVTASASYGVYGDVRSSSGSLGSLGYTGGLTDASGLVYLQARSLDTASGTFTARDPMTPGGPGITGFNPYAYVGQNPVTHTDPSGREALAEYRFVYTVVAVVVVAGVGTWAIEQELLKCLRTPSPCTLPLPRSWPWEGTGEGAGTGTTAIPWGRSIPIPVARPLPKEIPWELGPLVQVWRAVSSADNRSQFNWGPARDDVDGLSGTLAGVPPFWIQPQAAAWFTLATKHAPVVGSDQVRGASLSALLAAGFSIDWTPSLTTGDPYHVSIGKEQIEIGNDGAPNWRGTRPQRADIRARLESLFVIPVWPL